MKALGSIILSLLIKLCAFYGSLRVVVQFCFSNRSQNYRARLIIPLWQLRSKDVGFFDYGGVAEEVGGFGHEGGGDAAGEMGLAAGFIGEDVEDAEGGWAEANGKPCGGVQ
jgi:hypothetical protein